MILEKKESHELNGNNANYLDKGYLREGLYFSFLPFFTFHVIFTTRFKFQVKKVELHSAGIFFLKNIFFLAYLSVSVFLTTIPPSPLTNTDSITRQLLQQTHLSIYQFWDWNWVAMAFFNDCNWKIWFSCTPNLGEN